MTTYVHICRSLYGHGQGSKLGTLVMFPLEGLDMGRYLGTTGEAPYDLYAVSNHYGGAGGGHYTAYCKAWLDWTLFFLLSEVLEVLPWLTELGFIMAG